MRVLYLEGDPSGMKFVSGTLTRMGVVHEVVRPGCPRPHDLSKYQAVILSDFPYNSLHELGDLIVRLVDHAGQGLLMIGGWRSFGRGGYAGSTLGELLPVEMLEGDDRVNLPSGMVLEPVGSHPILRGLDFTRPVVVTGHNRVHPKARTTTVLAGRTIEGTADGVRLSGHRTPLLVVKEADGTRGRVAALSTDLAPHWSAGLTDWGRRRLDLGGDEEVGDEYASFVMNLVRWVAGEEVARRPLPSWEELAEIPTLEQPALRVDGGSSKAGSRRR